jgi:hypothetical protein
MAPHTLTLIEDGRTVTTEAAIQAGTIRLSSDALRNALGWELKAEGLCRAATCVPVRDRAALVHDDGIDLATLARLLDRPLALDADERVAVLGAPAVERAERLRSLDAPDFTLPDLAGRPHSLRDQRGKKTLLIAWASW